MGFSIGGTETAPDDVSYVTVNDETDLKNERTLNGGLNITLTDQGAGSTVDVENRGPNPDAEFVLGADDSSMSNSTTVSPASDILVSGDIDGTTSLSPGFDSWTQVDANNPALLIPQAGAETDGTSTGNVALDVDESGGTTADYELSITVAHPALPAGAFIEDNTTTVLPAGAQFQIKNISDPNNGNLIRKVRAQILSP